MMALRGCEEDERIILGYAIDRDGRTVHGCIAETQATHA